MDNLEPDTEDEHLRLDEETGQFIYTDAPSQSVVMYQLGGRLYPMRSEPRCNTCQSSYRLEVEKKVLRGYGYTAIANSLPSDAGLSVSSIRAHFRNGHLPLDETVKRAAVEARASELGLDLEAHEQSLVDHITFAKVGVQKAFERVMNGDEEVTVSDGIALANLLARVEQTAQGGVDSELMSEVFHAYMRAFVSVVTSTEQQQQFARMLGRDPVMVALYSRWQSQPQLEESSIEDAEIA
jgi:hypothetical protein